MRIPKIPITDYESIEKEFLFADYQLGFKKLVSVRL